MPKSFYRLISRYLPASRKRRLRRMFGVLAAALISISLVLVLTGMLPLDSPDPMGSLSDNLASVVDTVRTEIAGPRSFDPPAEARALPPPAAGVDPAAVPAIPTLPAPAPAPSLTPVVRGDLKAASPKIASVRQPVYSATDFMAAYLGNITYPVLLEGKPWDNGSVNYAQYIEQGGGTSYWDYFIEDEPWDSSKHMWRDDVGNWHTYSKEKITDSTGRGVTSYVMVDRDGPGVMDKLWFTHDAVAALFGIFNQPDPPEVRDWGNLHKLGNLRIEVDRKIVYDGPVEDWFSGAAQNVPDSLKDLFVWRYGIFGANGNIIPIPYNEHIKVSTYGGSGKPKWFMATGLTFPRDTRIQSYTGNDLSMSAIEALAQNVYQPESFLDRQDITQDFTFYITANQPAEIALQGKGAITALQFRLPKGMDPKQLTLTVQYGSEIGMSLPLLAFFSDPDVLALHRSAPIGVIDAGDSILFYSNLPMPYQEGMQIQISSDGSAVIPLTARIATSDQVYNTQLRVTFAPNMKLAAYGPNFEVDLSGNGKMVGLVLSTKDQLYDKIPRPGSGSNDAGHRVWPMGYLEGNLTITDGKGNARYYSGQEDWAEGGYYFNDGFTIPPGGANRPFAGVMRYRQGGNNGFATLFRYFNDVSSFPFKDGLHLSFGHGTWRNNYPVTYSAVIFYYAEVSGAPVVALPASEYVTVTVPQPDGTRP